MVILVLAGLAFIAMGITVTVCFTDDDEEEFNWWEE